jgi:hypothetical protein
LAPVLQCDRADRQLHQLPFRKPRVFFERDRFAVDDTVDHLAHD